MKMRRWQFLWVVGVTALCVAGTASCSKTDESSSAEAHLAAQAAPQRSGPESFGDMLAEVCTDVAKVSSREDGVGERRICILEEMHTGTAAQIETAIMLLRLHDTYGLRNIVLEALVAGETFPSTDWFRALCGPEDDRLRDELAVTLLRSAEIGAVEFIALVRDDVTVHPGDAAEAYAVELSDRGGVAAISYLFKIGLQSVKDEDLEHLKKLKDDEKIEELVEYVIGLDPWAKKRHDQLKDTETISSIEQWLAMLEEIQEKANDVGAQITDEEREAMGEAIAFFTAAEERSGALVASAVGGAVGTRPGLVAINCGAAHTVGVKRRLSEAKATHAVLTPLSLTLAAGSIRYEAFERKLKRQSVAWDGKGLASYLDGRRKNPPIIGTEWFAAVSELHFATALIARAGGGPGFPDGTLKGKLAELEHVRVDWDSVERQRNGDVVFSASVSGAKGRKTIWVRCGIPEGEIMVPGTEEEGGPALVDLLFEALGKVKAEKGQREEPEEGTVLESVTPDVLAGFSPDRGAVMTLRITG